MLNLLLTEIQNNFFINNIMFTLKVKDVNGKRQTCTRKNIVCVGGWGATFYLKMWRIHNQFY